MKTSKTVMLCFVAALLFAVLAGCGAKKEKVLIYTSSEDFKIENMTKRLNEKFPNYEITIEYMPTGNHAAKLLAEGLNTECDITHDLEYGYLAQLDNAGYLADLSDFDKSRYTDDVNLSDNYIIELRNSGSIILNTDVLRDRNLPVPSSYDDLLNSVYKGLISMPNPRSSGTGYMFLKSLVNAWGEEKAFVYFDQLNENILQYTSSGSGPCKSLIMGEVAIGLGMTAQAVNEINKGAPLQIVSFEEGLPYTLYGQAIINGKEQRKAVKEVFEYLVNKYNYENNELFFPEKIYKDRDYSVENYPQNIKYSDMRNDSIEEKDRLLKKWKY
ncbi:MAG: extracellular solute-binding protein [Oscillospiraceae bacterium]|nr:extracellular solute-binding protein [Oscillospiraceae bacterium]